ncbi:Ubiquitin carboxyl-terminal hydrolase [Aphelenchoides fujianensis]|nr:Ubiquitin carboxyl-terminal hydrolase [Aphelenchoides fujianensis]
MNGTLFEFDSRMPFPRACGPTSQDTLIKDAGVHCKELAAKLENVSFCAIALVGGDGRVSDDDERVPSFRPLS